MCDILSSFSRLVYWTRRVLRWWESRTSAGLPLTILWLTGLQKTRMFLPRSLLSPYQAERRYFEFFLFFISLMPCLTLTQYGTSLDIAEYTFYVAVPLAHGTVGALYIISCFLVFLTAIYTCSHLPFWLLFALSHISYFKCIFSFLLKV